MQKEKFIDITNESNNDNNFLNFNNKDLSLFKNIAKECTNYNILREVHLPPYYYCLLCKKEYCYNCIINHLIKNNKDKNHNLYNIITKDLIKYSIENILNELNESNPPLLMH